MILIPTQTIYGTFSICCQFSCPLPCLKRCLFIGPLSASFVWSGERYLKETWFDCVHFSFCLESIGYLEHAWFDIPCFLKKFCLELTLRLGNTLCRSKAPQSMVLFFCFDDRQTLPMASRVSYYLSVDL